MLNLDIDGTRIRARTQDGDTTTLEVEGWVGQDDVHHEFPHTHPEEAVSGYASQLRLREYENVPSIQTGDRGLPDGIDPDDDNATPTGYNINEELSLSLPGDDYRFEYQSNPFMVVRFSGEVTVRAGEPDHPSGDGLVVVLSFPTPRLVTVTFQTIQRGSRDTITVPETTEGVATALSHLSAAHQTTAPDKAYAGYRETPPHIEFGDTVDIPEAVADAVPDTGIEFRLPDRLEAIYPASTLAYYLGADVTLEAGATPTLRAPDAGLEYTVPETDYETEVNALLRHVFYMDFLVMGNDREMNLPGMDVFADAGVDPGALYDQSVADRLATYLDVPREPLVDATPEWPYTVGVEPSLEYAPTLATLLDVLPQLYGSPPSGGSDGRDAAGWLDGGFQHITGWLGEGRPDTGGKLLPEAYDHRHEEPPDTDADISMVVVRTDTDRLPAEAIDAYQSVSTVYDVDVEVVDDPTCERLQSVFERQTDLLQYVGECTDEGFVCRDGTLPVSAVTDVGARVSVLSAADSYDHAVALVQGGGVTSVAFDEAAGRAGETAVKTLLTGTDVWAAGEYERAFGETESVVPVGDPTAHCVRQAFGFYSLTVVEDPTGPEEPFGLDQKSMYVDPGITLTEPTLTDETFFGCLHMSSEVDAADIRDEFGDSDDGVVYDGRLYWPAITEPFYPIV